MTRKFEGKSLLMATHNAGKLEEMRHLLQPYGVTVTGGAEIGLPEPEETEDTFVGNARIKAHAAVSHSGLPALSDDSGIEIDALGGAPGVYTADWAETAHGRDFAMAMERAHRELEAISAPEPRTARFCCTLVLAWPDGHDEVFTGAIDGRVTWPMRGEQGHGYDPMFIPNGYDITLGQMDRWEKNKISHRADAVKKLLAEALTEDWQSGGFGLYVHWPFCQAKCPYCDFNSHVSAKINQNDWVRAYLWELERSSIQTRGRVLNSIFFGGGTPSLMSVTTVAEVIDRALQLWTPANNLEITLEANPSSVEAARFAGYRDAGVNRVSLGFQALNDGDLKRLGRLHSVQDALSALDIAKKHFDRVSFDLIYARQNQTLEDWEVELRTALDMDVDHLSLYQLTIEPGTAFGDRFKAGKLAGLPNEDLSSDQFELTQEMCRSAGYTAYEVSNHAKPGAESLHNQIYWRYGDYVGIGPGAHGRVTVNGAKTATETHLSPAKWLQAVSAGSGEVSATQLSPREQFEEYLIMGLRLTEGIDVQRFQRLAGASLPSHVSVELMELGLVEIVGGRLRATATGRPLLNSIIRAYLTA